MYGQVGGSHATGVFVECLWVRSAHAAVGAPLENAETSLMKSTSTARRQSRQASTNFITSLKRLHRADNQVLAMDRDNFYSSGVSVEFIAS